MKSSLELQPGALRDLASDGAAAFPVLRATGPAPRIELVAEGERVSLAPGQYFIEVTARVLEGAFTATLEASGSGGGALHVALSEISPGVWRGVLETNRAVDALSLTFAPELEAFVFVSAAIETDEGDAHDAPSLTAAAVMGGRAVFRALPQSLRRTLLGSRRRAEWLARARGSAGSSSQAASGRFVANGGSNDAFRADFENRQAVARGLTDPAYTERLPDAPPVSPDGVKLVAFHLPQFHPIPENDAWWGKGFTEWSNVAKAAPQFLGHYQPRLPGELGFYDLRTPGALKRQAELARAYGVSAFCFHYYWFAGERLLEAPLDAFLADKSIDIEFALCWANENWTRRWDGDESEVLIAQQHSIEDHARVFADMARYMEDPRYLRIDGKPLLTVYRPAIIGDAREMTDLWRKLAAERGWPGLFLVASSAFRFDEPEALGFDALVEFPPHGFVADRVESQLKWLNDAHRGQVFDYGDVAAREAERMARAGAGRAPVIPGVMPSWDNEARRPGAGAVYHGATPAAYGAWLRAAIARAARTLPAGQRFVFINAWNEWAEGAYLEPDRAFGRAFLLETARALSGR